MSHLIFAHKVDSFIFTKYRRNRSSFSRTQKMIADKMIIDHFEAKSSVEEAVLTIWPVLNTLERM